MSSNPVQLIRPRRFGDDRGWFVESWNRDRFAALGIRCEFVQDNHSMSAAVGTLRGLHFQRPPHAQAKLVRCLRGRIFDVAVDLRKGSPTYGHWVGATLTGEGGEQLFVPVGFAHGFVTLEPGSEVAYKTSAAYAPDCDAGIRWDDPTIGVEWPLPAHGPTLSAKDQRQPALAGFDTPFAYDGRPLQPLGEALVP
ncbi:dTDP-4-dehydrorhamnose 3,5-epimerase [Roseomonas sp. M0104]|uniref:dTDP-4-dehydrorhamnose 3,5-epimerase n=1 Tax=Teichococcus coralli TaxID=2545983 RepID=A0A845BHQ3_9PROT|nr:dTDP-4-dehydrorhamnose 3,5-epimerase [Pseudoroseomonas coralli]MXP62979.1 dTDP-4-dehydrorhamnose 3,5-epimerase [Pseudoroseomonas coralli]